MPFIKNSGFGTTFASFDTTDFSITHSAIWYCLLTEPGVRLRDRLVGQIKHCWNKYEIWHQLIQASIHNSNITDEK